MDFFIIRFFDIDCPDGIWGCEVLHMKKGFAKFKDGILYVSDKEMISVVKNEYKERKFGEIKIVDLSILDHDEMTTYGR